MALFCAPSVAQEEKDYIFAEPWTLDRCIEYALEHNIGIKRKELEKEAKKVVVSESRWSYAPSLYFSTRGSESSGRVLDQTTYEFIKNSIVGNASSSIAGTMELFSGMRRVYALQRAKIDLLSKTVNIESLKYDIRKNVTASFFAALCAEANYGSAKKARALLVAQLERITLLVEAGKVTETDLLQARAQLFSAECDVVTAEGNVETTKMELCQILEIKDYATFSIREDSNIPLDDLAWSRLGNPVLSRPEYRSAELVIELARKDLSITRSAFYPSISLSAGFGSSYSTALQRHIRNPDGTSRYEVYPFLEQYSYNKSSYISLSLNIPIFNAMTTHNAVRKSKIAIRDAEYGLQKIEKELSKEYMQAEIDCRTAYKKYIAAQKQLAFAEEAERQMRERYEMGASDFNAWSKAATELAKVRYSLSEAKYTYIFERKILEMF